MRLVSFRCCPAMPGLLTHPQPGWAEPAKPNTTIGSGFGGMVVNYSSSHLFSRLLLVALNYLIQ